MCANIDAKNTRTVNITMQSPQAENIIFITTRHIVRIIFNNMFPTI